MTSKPTARERFESMIHGGFRLEDDRVDFLIKLVEAAESSYSELCYQNGLGKENDNGNERKEWFWQEIDQRVKETNS